MTETLAAAAAVVALVAMTRPEPQFEGGPTTADVHPEEVESWIAHGWRFAGGEGEQLAGSTPVAKPLAEQSIEELRTTATAEGVAWSPRTGQPRLIADITAAREAAAVAAELAAAEAQQAGEGGEGEGQGADV